jgi:ferredoxin-type protein NapG
MDRRSFFRSALKKSAKTVVKTMDNHVNKQATRWLRPPYAINELDFLLSCTRCRDCIEACPHQVIFSLAPKVGAKAVGTPALDLLNKGCHLCEDWPCVVACTVNALQLPEINSPENSEQTDANIEKIALPKLAKASINSADCLPYSGPECGACLASCKVQGALTLDMSKPIINQTLCTGCGLCREHCITEPKAINISANPIKNHGVQIDPNHTREL